MKTVTVDPVSLVQLVDSIGSCVPVCSSTLVASSAKSDDRAIDRSKSSLAAPHGLFHCRVTSMEHPLGMVTVLPRSAPLVVVDGRVPVGKVLSDQTRVGRPILLLGAVAGRARVHPAVLGEGAHRLRDHAVLELGLAEEAEVVDDHAAPRLPRSALIPCTISRARIGTPEAERGARREVVDDLEHGSALVRGSRPEGPSTNGRSPLSWEIDQRNTTPSEITPTLTPAPVTPKRSRARSARERASPSVEARPTDSRIPYAGGRTCLTKSSPATMSTALLAIQPWTRPNSGRLPSTRNPAVSS